MIILKAHPWGTELVSPKNLLEVQIFETFPLPTESDRGSPSPESESKAKLSDPLVPSQGWDGDSAPRSHPGIQLLLS